MTRRFFPIWLILALAVPVVIAQTPTPTPAPTPDEMQRLQDQIELLKKQKDYEKAKHDLDTERLNQILALVKRPEGAAQAVGSKTEFQDATKASPEAAALSYQALMELSSQIESTIRPSTSRYAAIIIYNEPDFLSLAKFRLYDRQATGTLDDYKAWRKKIEAFVDSDRVQAQNRPEKARILGGVETILSLPTIATGVSASIGDLISLFRTESKIYQAYNTVDDASLATAVANELAKGNSNLKIYFPGAFVPEYDIASEGGRSILWTVSDVNAANMWILEFLARCKVLPPTEQGRPELRSLVIEAMTIQGKLQSLSIGDQKVGGQTGNRGGEETAQSRQAPFTDLRALIRGEKLDSFIRQGAQTIGSQTGPKVGVLKVRILASGGSIKESRNIFFGNKVRYSGSVTLEVQVFDVDGTLRESQIFSGHTGFRKLDTIKQ